MYGIILTVVGLAAIAIFSKHAYSSAKETGKNAGLLVFINIAFGIFFQWVYPFMAMVAVVVIMLVGGAGSYNIERDVGFFLPLAFSVVGLVLSAIAMLRVLKYASRFSDEIPAGADASPPPPPPTFDQGI